MEQNKSKEGRLFSLLDPRHPSSPALGHRSSQFLAFELQDLHHDTYCWPADRLNSSLHLQFSEGRLLSLHNHGSQSLQCLLFCMSLYISIGSASLENRDKYTYFYIPPCMVFIFLHINLNLREGHPQPEFVKSQTSCNYRRSICIWAYFF